MIRPPGDGEPDEAPIPWFIRAAQDMVTKGNIAEAQSTREHPWSPPEPVIWQSLPPRSDAAAAVPEPEVDEDGVLRMRWPVAGELVVAGFRDRDDVFEEPAGAAPEIATSSASGHTGRLVIAGLAFAVAAGSSILVFRQSGDGTAEMHVPLEAPTHFAVANTKPPAPRAETADVLPPARSAPVFAAPAAALAVTAQASKPRTQRSNEGLGSAPARTRSRPQILASAMPPMPEAAEARTLPARSAETFAADTPVTPTAPQMPPAPASNQLAEAANEPEALAIAVEAGAEPEPATAEGKPRRRRAVLPQCKGFQLYRPTTPCSISGTR